MRKQVSNDVLDTFDIFSGLPESDDTLEIIQSFATNDCYVPPLLTLPTKKVSLKRQSRQITTNRTTLQISKAPIQDEQIGEIFTFILSKERSKDDMFESFDQLFFKYPQLKLDIDNPNSTHFIWRDVVKDSTPKKSKNKLTFDLKILMTNIELAYDRLLKARNNMKHILSVLTAETNKLKILRLMGLFEGDEGTYVGGGDPSPATMRAVLFYETEGGVLAKQRKGSKRGTEPTTTAVEIPLAVKKLKSIPVYVVPLVGLSLSYPAVDSLSCVAFAPSEVLVPVTLSAQPTLSSEGSDGDAQSHDTHQQQQILSEEEVHELLNDVSGWVVQL